MAEIISVANQKGGVGKTTTAINFSAALAYLGQETLLIDLDPQANASSGVGLGSHESGINIYDAIIDGIPAEKTIRQSSVEMLDLIPSSQDLVSAEMDLANQISRESRLKSILSGIKHLYKFIVIDCPPSLGLLTINALCASNKVIIPVQGEYYSLEGLARFYDAIRKIKENINGSLEIEGGVLTMFDPRMSLSQQVKIELHKFFGDSMFKTSIPRSVRLAEAPSFGKTIFQYDPRSKGSENYLALAGEFLIRRGWRGMRIN